MMLAPTGLIKSMQAVSVHLFKQADGAGSKVRLAGPDLALVQVAQHKGNDSPALHRVLIRRTVPGSSVPIGITEKVCCWL